MLISKTAILQMAMLEMKELNERQKSEHATRMYHKLKSSIDELQKRNSELEDKFNQVRLCLYHCVNLFSLLLLYFVITP